MSFWAEFAQVLIAGLTNGAIYALIALGFSLVFSVSGFLNLVQGEYVIIGGLVTIALTEWMGVPLAPAVVAAVVVAGIFGLVLQRLSLSPARRLTPDAALIVTLGGAFIARGGAMVVFGKDPLALPSFSGERPVIVGTVTIATQSFWILATLALSSATLWWFFHRTYTGKAMRACAQSPTGARLVGIDLKHMATVTFVTSALLGGIAGVVVAPLNFVAYDEGLAIGIKGFIAAIFGGLGSYPGAVVGGLILGLGESLGAAYLSSQFKDAIAFVALLAVLLVRPNGILWGPAVMAGARRSNKLLTLAAFAAGIALFYVLLRGQYLLSALVLAGIYATVIVGIVLLSGLSGQYSLGHAAFFGIGAYASALISLAGVPVWASCILATALTTASAVVIGVPILRLKGYYLALATLAFCLIVLSVLNGWHSFTMGPSGLGGISKFEIAGFVFKSEDANYWLVWIVAFFAVWGGINLWQSRLGQALLAVKRDEDGAAAVGINVAWVKLQVFALSAAFAGLGGALYAHYVTFIAPERFNMVASFELLLAALLGGIGTPFGAVFGALLLVALPEVVVFLRDYKVIVYGLVFILVSLYLPQGFAGLVRWPLAWRRQHVDAAGSSSASGARDSARPAPAKVGEHA